jgi:hypothetical protein
VTDRMKPSDVPDEFVRLGAQGQIGVGLREALARILPEHEQQVLNKVTAVLEALRDGVHGKDKPYNQAFMHALDCAIREITKETR